MARREALASSFAVAAAVCVVLAIVSGLLLPTVPSYDPWSWIVWGREVLDPHLSFAVGGGPSWKPLPVLFTTVYGPLGGAAPKLWVITGRAGGLLALVAAYRLAALLIRREPAPPWTPVIAGLVAAAGVWLTQEWTYYMFRGTSEPMLVGASLWAVEHHLRGHRAQAFAFGVAASLIRPEAWPFILAYAVWLWRREPNLRPYLVGGLLLIPLLWFVPPWVGSGQPFLAASHAKAYNGHLGKHKLLEVIRRGADLQVAPMLALALLGVAVAWWRSRDRLIAALAGGAATWWLLVIGMTLVGYPGLERFYLPAAGLTCVLAGYGLVRVALLAGWFVTDRFSSRKPSSSSGAARPQSTGTAALVAGVAALLVLVSVPFATTRVDEARAQKPIASRAVTRLDQLSDAVGAVGGHRGVYPCRTSFAAVNHGVQTALAWKLHVTLGRVGTAMRHAGVLFVGPHDSIDGQPASLSHRLNRMRLIATVGVWRVYQVWRSGHFSHCVGGRPRGA